MKSAIRIFGAMGLLSLVAACAPDFEPPPGYQGGYLWNSDRSRTITVEGGDTLYTISRRYDVPTKVIAERNGLQPPYQLTAGQTLILDPTRVHVVADGDTLASISQRYGVDQGALAAANDLRPPYQIHAGLELWIPDPFTNAASTYVASTAGDNPPPPRAAPTASVASADLPPVSTAPAGSRPTTSETLPPVGGAVAGIAGGAAGVSGGAVSTAGSGVAGMAEEPLSSPVRPQPPPPRLGPAETAPLQSPAAPVVPPPVPLTPPPVAAPAQSQMALAAPNPASAVGGRFTWPVNGKVVAKFGPAGKGLHNDGINIAAPAGTQVRAADAGDVVYAGNELRGFGNLLLIKHADGWTTAYAHNDKLLVAKGDKVTQGQVVATVGRTGNVDSPQLHFEVRKGTQALDPLEYLTGTGG